MAKLVKLETAADMLFTPPAGYVTSTIGTDAEGLITELIKKSDGTITSIGGGGGSSDGYVVVEVDGVLKAQKLAFDGTTASPDGSAEEIGSVGIFNTGMEEPAYKGMGGGGSSEIDLIKSKGFWIVDKNSGMGTDTNITYTGDGIRVFNGSSSKVTAPIKDVFQKLTVLVRFKINTMVPAAFLINQRKYWANSVNNMVYSMGFRDQRLHFVPFDGVGFEEDRAVYATSSFTDGVFYVVAGTYDGNTIKIYVNGVLENSMDAQIELPIPELELYHTVGSPSVEQGGGIGVGWFNGEISHAAVFPTALSEDDILLISSYLNN